jgi:chemotaxis protein CheD
MCPEAEIREIFLNPGDHAFGDASTRIRTILGSCVAVTFWHPGLRIGAMCHYLLPSRAPTLNDQTGGKYGEEIIPLIAARFRDMGLLPAAFQVKMFGGSNMFSASAPSDGLNVGGRNIQAGQAALARCGFMVANQDLAGGTNRTVVFDIGTGEVWVRQGQAAFQQACAAGGRRR